MAVRLNPDEIEVHLARLTSWSRNGEEISRCFKFADFKIAVKFVDAVAELAEADDHHPDIDIRWNKVLLRLSTHSAGGLSSKDFALAEKIDALT